MSLWREIKRRGLLEAVFGDRVDKVVLQHFKMLSGYTPVYSTREGGLYEMELTRAAVHTKAKHSAKLKAEVLGSSPAAQRVKPLLDSKPNSFMDTTKMLYRLRTILECTTTAYIIPITDKTGTVVEGFFPVLPAHCEIVEVDGVPWLRYTFSNGQSAVVEASRVGITTTHQYRSDFFGDGHQALAPTLDLLDLQRQGMSDAVKQSATIRFMGRLAGSLRPEDIAAERDRFSRENLSSENTSGLILADGKFADLQQIESKPFVIDADQMKLIKDNVYSYFGVNEAVLQNSYDESGWNAFYEGEIETFALQLSMVLTNMLFTDRERAAGNQIMFSSNRLQYASMTTKLQVVRDMTDRGHMSNYMACDIFNLPYPKDADGNRLPERWVIRGEYIDISNLPDNTVDNAKAVAAAAAAAKAADPDSKE